MNFTPTTVAILAGIAILTTAFALIVGIYVASAARNRKRLLAAVGGSHPGSSNEGDYSSYLPGAGSSSHIVLPTPFKRLPQGLLRGYANRLARAGRYELKDLEHFLDFKAGLTSIGLILMLIELTVGSTVALTGALALTILLFFAPDLWVYDRGVNRSEAIETELPEAIDLMYLCVSAGLGIDAALAKVALNQNGPAAEELTRVLNEILLGGNRAAAFRAMDSRTNNTNLREFSEMMIKVDQLGIPLKSIFEELAQLMREKRLARVRSKAQQVQVKILAPLVICFLPAIFIVVLGPAVHSIFGIFKH